MKLRLISLINYNEDGVSMSYKKDPKLFQDGLLISEDNDVFQISEGLIITEHNEDDEEEEKDKDELKYFNEKDNKEDK